MLSNTESLLIMDMYAAGAVMCILGGLFIILTYLPLRILHTPTSTIIFFLGLADLFLGASNLSSYFIRLYNGPDILCTLQAAGTQFFAVCSFLWRACFSYHAYAALCQQRSREDLQSYIKYYFVICVFCPLAIMAACIELNAFGPTEEKHLYCWITHDQIWMRFAFYYIPLVSIWTFNIVIYCLLSRQMKSLLTYEHLINKQRRKLRFYLLAFIVLKMPALVNRVLNAFGIMIFELFMVQSVCDGMLGLADAVIYAYTNRIVYILLTKYSSKHSSHSTHSPPNSSHNSELSINASSEPLLHDFPPYANSISERLLLKQHRNLTSL